MCMYMYKRYSKVYKYSDCYITTDLSLDPACPSPPPSLVPYFSPLPSPVPYTIVTLY